MLKKFQMEVFKLVNTPMVRGWKLSKNDESNEVEKNMHRSMIGSLLYVTTLSPNVMQVVGVVSIFYSAPKETYI